METHSSYEICPEERKLLVTGYLFGPRQDVSTFRIHNLTAWCREYCELCVRLVMDVEREPQESSAASGKLRSLWSSDGLALPRLRPPRVKVLTLCQAHPSATSWLSSPFLPKFEEEGSERKTTASTRIAERGLAGRRYVSHQGPGTGVRGWGRELGPPSGLPSPLGHFLTSG